MSRENLELARALADAFNRRDWDAFLAMTHEEVEMESRLVAIEGGYHGPAGLRRWWDTFLGVFPDYTVGIEELRDLGDVTIAHVRGSGHAGDSPTPLIDPSWQVITWRDGTCLRWRICSTEKEALEAAQRS